MQEALYQGFQQYGGYGNQRNRTSNNGTWGNILGAIINRP
jgi:hypothetical protein